MINWASFKPETGKLLLSEPFLSDPHFVRSAILITSHNPNGSNGLVLNQPMPGIFLADIDGLPSPRITIYEGGPVGHDTLHFIHLMGNAIPGSTDIGNGLYLDGDLAVAKKMLRKKGPQYFRFFIGYSGWGMGQLEAELEAHTWIVTDANPLGIFHTEPDKLWEETMRSLGTDGLLMARYPLNPTWN